MKRNVILTDIDHTIADAFWRDGMMPPTTTWDEYHEKSIHDEPISDMIELMWALRNAGWIIVGVTARPEKWRKLTMDWLIKHCVPMTELLMRPDGNYNQAPIVKMELVKRRFPQLEEIAFVFDDRDDVIASFKEAGIMTLQVYGRRK